jgi:VWFA-related protein
MTRWVPALSLTAALTLAVPGVRAQRGSRNAPQTTFRSTTELILVNTVVTDGRDRVVTDLTRDDFVVTADGHEQRIDEFSFVYIPPGDRTVDLDAPTRPPADVASNAETPSKSRAFVFVIDDGRIPPRELVPLKRMMAAVIRTLSPDDQVAIVYTGHSDLSYDFTNDTDRLIDAVNRRREALGFSDGMALPMGQRSLMITLRNIVKTLQSSKHARRAVFLVGSSGCLPHPPNPDWAECLDLVNKARQADVPFYVLDPRLFINGDIVSATDPDMRAAAVDAEATRRDEMMTLASATGGRVVSRVGDPVRAAAQAVAENGSFYLLGFYPSPAPRDGKFHQITVTLRRPGLSVRARRGYLAPSPVVRASTPTRDMTATLGSGLDDPSLPIRAFAAPMAPAPSGKTRTLVTVELTYPRDSAMPALDEDLRVGVLALTPDAKIKASFQRPIHLSGSWLPESTGRIVMNETVDLPSERLSLRVGVTSRALNASGTAHLYVDPPDFGSKDLTLSGVVLGQTGVVVDAVTGLDTIRGVVPFEPTINRSFSSTDTIRVFARAYWKRDAERASAVVRVTGGEGLPPRSVALTARARPGGGHDGVLDTLVPLRGLAAGAYVLEVEAMLPGGKPVERRVPFEVR